MRKLVHFASLPVLFCALALAAPSVARPTSTVWTAALSSGQEVPKQVVSERTPRTTTFKLGAQRCQPEVSRLTFMKLDRGCDRRTHPPRREGRVGERGRSFRSARPAEPS